MRRGGELERGDTMSGKTANEAKLSIRIDAELKERFDEALDELGTDFTNAVRMLASQIARSGTLPFDAAPTAFKACRTSKVVSVRLKDATSARTRAVFDGIGIGIPTAVRMPALRTAEDRAPALQAERIELLQCGKGRRLSISTTY